MDNFEWKLGSVKLLRLLFMGTDKFWFHIPVNKLKHRERIKRVM